MYTNRIDSVVIKDPLSYVIFGYDCIYGNVKMHMCFRLSAMFLLS